MPGVQRGDRTLAEQLKGLEPMLAEVKGKSVLDLGCAEGLITQVCVQHGARHVYGLDNNPGFIAKADSLGLDPHRAYFVMHDLNRIDRDVEACAHADIVLALAIFHKLTDPAAMVPAWARFAWDLLVIRLPSHGADGVIRSKYRAANSVNLKQALPACGFRLEQQLPGPRGEPVQYWRREK